MTRRAAATVLALGLSLAALAPALAAVLPRRPAATVAAALLAVCGLVAALVPAWRGSRVNPLSALRTE
jgi:ABC-type antimicrobial peptide transport system permease subunit